MATVWLQYDDSILMTSRQVETPTQLPGSCHPKYRRLLLAVEDQPNKIDKIREKLGTENVSYLAVCVEKKST